MVVDTIDHSFFHPRTESKPVKDIDFALDQTNFLQILSESEEIEVKLGKKKKRKIMEIIKSLIYFKNITKMSF